MIHTRTAKRAYSRILFIGILGVMLLVSIVFASIHYSSSANAMAITGFKAGDIMSDAVMSNSSTMTEKQIQTFLKSKNSCNKPVSGSGVIVYSSTRAYVKGTINGKAAIWWWNIKGGADGHFICMADDSFSGQSAAHIIYRAAQDYNINPQVLIVLLQKEQGLITDQWPNDHQYAAATGYDCPDTPSGCNNDNAGFITQIRDAASLFHTVLTGGWSNYPVGDNVILYNPSTSCGSSHVNIVNRATSSLYRYTPYQPNSATLKGGWPSPVTGCGAYGNLNFYMYFTTWFGNTHYTISGSILKYYNANNGSVVLGEAIDKMRTNGHGFYWQEFENGYVAGEADTGYYTIKGSIGNYYGSHNGPSLVGKPLAEEQKDSATGIWSQKFAKGHIVGLGGVGYYSIRGALDTSYQKDGGISKYGQPLAEPKGIGSGAYSQQFQNGYIVGSNATGYYESSGPLRDYWLAHDANKDRLGLPISNLTTIGTGIYQLYQGGVIIGSSDTGYYAVKGAIGQTYLDNITKHFDNLGLPLSNEQNIGGPYIQQFQNGYITGASGHYYRTSNAIYDYWKANGAQNGRLRLPIGSASSLGSGEVQAYDGGAIIGSSTSGYYAVKGAIGATYLSNTSQYYNDIGLPVANESKASGIWQQKFSKGYITGASGHYYDMSNTIYNYWQKLNAQTGKMKLPIGNVITSSSGASWQHFASGGVIIVNPKDGSAWESNGSLRRVWGSLGYQNGKLGYPAGPETFSASNRIWSQVYEHGKIETKNSVLYKVIYY